MPFFEAVQNNIEEGAFAWMKYTVKYTEDAVDKHPYTASAWSGMLEFYIRFISSRYSRWNMFQAPYIGEQNVTKPIAGLQIYGIFTWRQSQRDITRIIGSHCTN